jgi:hypothetical protein
LESLTAEQWATIDEHLLACDILGAFMAIRAAQTTLPGYLCLVDGEELGR